MKDYSKLSVYTKDNSYLLESLNGIFRVKGVTTQFKYIVHSKYYLIRLVTYQTKSSYHYIIVQVNMNKQFKKFDCFNTIDIIVERKTEDQLSDYGKNGKFGFILKDVLSVSEDSMFPIQYCPTHDKFELWHDSVFACCSKDHDIMVGYNTKELRDRYYHREGMDTNMEETKNFITKEEVQKQIDSYREQEGSAGEISDGYHTFNELYNHRAMLFASLCLTTFSNKAWKSLLHSNPDDPMYPGMFIVGVDTPFGQATYHYDIDPYWSIFKVKELDRAPEFDGHTPNEAIDRIFKYAKKIGTESATRSINISDPGFYNIEPQLQYVNEVDTTGIPIMRTGINISTTKKDDHNSTTLK